jgi:hypothetical protein
VYLPGVSDETGPYVLRICLVRNPLEFNLLAGNGIMGITMKHLFTFLAAISLLICLFFVVLTATTFNSSKTVPLGERGERTYEFRADSLEFTYQGKLTTFDDRIGFSTEMTKKWGVEYDVQHRVKTDTLSDATGFVLVVPALYPIALFAILPIVWIVGVIGRKKARPVESSTDEPSDKI